MLRCDYGTENSNLAAIHIAFRYYHDDSMAREKSFIYGPSIHNIVRNIIASYMHVYSYTEYNSTEN